MNQLKICIRAILVTAIYRKSLTLGVMETEESAAVTLMTADVDGIEQLISLVYDSFAMVLVIGLGVWVLAIFVGEASIFTVITAVRKLPSSAPLLPLFLFLSSQQS